MSYIFSKQVFIRRKENIMDNVQEIVELTVEELEERTAPGLVVVF